MDHPLTVHPDTPATAVSCISAVLKRSRADSLAIDYVLTGILPELRIPPAGSEGRQDDLWRHTCFELFLRTPGEAAYLEYNFSPAGAWAAYRFAGYRSGRADAPIDPPQLAVVSDAGQLSLHVALSGLPAGPWQLGLAAVVEGGDGGISYWALKHPPGQPDFHHKDCFAIEVAPAP